MTATRGRPTKEATAQLELVARGQEAHLFAAALRVVVRELEAVLLRPSDDVPVEALQLTARLRGMSDRYAGRWESVA